MKYFFTILFLSSFVANTYAQWSNTTNLFTDALHMPVVTSAGVQQYSMSINSYPDSGYIVFWEDERSSSTNKKDIYAQKYDASGNKLWGANGKPVANGLNNEHFYSSQNTDYRNYSYACTDSAGGFYMCYLDDSIQTYDWQRVCVQHLTSGGAKVFPKGYILAQTPAGQTYNYGLPQLIADGNDGFFISYTVSDAAYINLLVNCYKDVSGTIKYYGGGYVDMDYTVDETVCPQQLVSREAIVNDYMIYPDLQNGCNVAMSLTDNSVPNTPSFTAYNKLVRVKKTLNVTTDNGGVITYKKDSVMVFYMPISHTITVTCAGGGIGTAYILDGNGYAYTGNAGNNIAYSKGVTLATNGNINVDVITANARNITGNTLTNWFTEAAYIKSEIYTDVPYQFKHAPYRPQSYINDGNPNLNTLTGAANDTLFYNASPYPYEFAIKGSDAKIFLATRVYNGPFTNDILLQQLQLTQTSATSYSVDITTGAANYKGIKISNEISTGFETSNITLENPQIATDGKGNALFYINEVGRATRVSPIINKTQLAWGALGRRIGSGTTGTQYYEPENPFTSYGSIAGTAFTNLEEDRNIPVNSGTNIYGRHLDKLTATNYYPVYKPVKKLIGGNTLAYPEVMIGASLKYSLVEVLNYNNGTFSDASPIVDLLDNKNFGAVTVNIFQNTSDIRKYNNQPYLDRNYTVYSGNTLPANVAVNIRLFFTTDEFNAMRAADPSITSPSNLVAVHQPYSATNAASAYTPVSGQETLPPIGGASLSGGYYLEFSSKGLGNYFLFKKGGAFAGMMATKAIVNSSGFIISINPTMLTGNTLHIVTGNQQVKEMLVEVYGADGRRYYSMRLGYQSQTIQVPSLANGDYKVNISSGNFLFTGAFIKQ